jgi:hypothetical protein
MKSSSFSIKSIYALVACFVFALLLGAGTYWLCLVEVSQICLKVNPEVKIGLNRLDRVIRSENRSGNGWSYMEAVALNVHYTVTTEKWLAIIAEEELAEQAHFQVKSDYTEKSKKLEDTIRKQIEEVNLEGVEVFNENVDHQGDTPVIIETQDDESIEPPNELNIETESNMETEPNVETETETETVTETRDNPVEKTAPSPRTENVAVEVPVTRFEPEAEDGSGARDDSSKTSDERRKEALREHLQERLEEFHERQGERQEHFQELLNERQGELREQIRERISEQEEQRQGQINERREQLQERLGERLRH